jgi:signal peptidase I
MESRRDGGTSPSRVAERPGTSGPSPARPGTSGSSPERPGTSGSSPERPRTSGPSPARAATQALGLILLVTVSGLAFWSLAPLALGWRADVIMSGSMAPRVLPGDVVVGQPASGDDVRDGQVIVFENPADPSRTVLHRVVRRQDDGSLVTRGDANLADDSSPVDPAAVVAVPRLRVPYVGLPALWLEEGEHRRLLVASLALLVCALPLLSAPRRSPGRRADRERSAGTA